jgi:ABC-type Zn uptake system ZnuABC Zn-binding protein ZnuA
MNRILRALCWVALLVLAACSALPATALSGQPGGTGAAKLAVVTTVSPITNIVYNIGGERITLSGIVPAGVNSHTFEPAPSDARKLVEADLIFVSQQTVA